MMRAHRLPQADLRSVAVLSLAASTVLSACGPAEPLDDGAALDTVVGRQAFVNGADDRREYFELEEPQERAALEQFTVALMPRTAARVLTNGNPGALFTWGEIDALCEGEPFADQPSAAFCSGVLVDWDLVLTSGHCIDLLPIQDVRVVFGYYYQEPGKLAVSSADVYEAESVLAWRSDQDPRGARLDFAWLRLTEPVRPPHAPAAMYTSRPGLTLGDGIIGITAGGGAPFKFDAGGQIRDLREATQDYFVADTDTSEGSSGGGAFDGELALVGTLARGAPDFVPTESGCWVSDREEDPNRAREQFTYGYRAAEVLCEADPARRICDATCEQPCGPPAPPALVAGVDDGCALARRSASPPRGAVRLLAGPLVAGLLAVRRLATRRLAARRRTRMPRRRLAAALKALRA